MATHGRAHNPRVCALSDSVSAVILIVKCGDRGGLGLEDALGAVVGGLEWHPSSDVDPG